MSLSLAVLLLQLVCLLGQLVGSVILIRATRRWILLDKMLADLCVQSFVLQGAPLWKAWGETMGDIDVRAIGHRRMP